MIDPLYNFSVWAPDPPISRAVSQKATEEAMKALHQKQFGNLEMFSEKIFWKLFLIDDTNHFDGLPKVFFNSIDVIEHPNNRNHIAFRIIVSRRRVQFDQEAPHNLPHFLSHGDGWEPLLQAALGKKIGYSLINSDGRGSFATVDYYLSRFSKDELKHKKMSEWWNRRENKVYPIPVGEPIFRGVGFKLPAVEPFALIEASVETKVE